MTDRFRLVGSLALAALVAGGAYRAGARLPELGIDRSPLKEHVEAAAKRARFEAAARARALTGAVPPSVEGTDRGLDVLSYDIFFDVDPAIRFLSGTTVIRVAGFAPRTTSLALDLDGVTTSVTFPNPSKKFVAGIALDPAKDLLRIVESTGPA